MWDLTTALDLMNKTSEKSCKPLDMRNLFYIFVHLKIHLADEKKKPFSGQLFRQPSYN